MSARRMDKGERPDWLVRAGSGIDHGETIVGVFEGARFAVVKFPGYSCWNGIGMPRVYGKMEYSLLEKGKGILSAKMLHQGRATARDLGRMQLTLEAEERKGSL